MTTLSDIEELGYLGMRLALRRSFDREQLRDHARACAVRRNSNLRYWIEHDQLPTVQTDGLEHVINAQREGLGAVVTSFQLGQYNWLPLVLNQLAHLPVALLMDAANFQQERHRWAVRESQYQGALADPVRYINSEEATAAWKMASALRSGRTLVGWFDGHTGATSADTAKSSLTVDFFESKMRIRMGLAYLSGMTGAALILAVARDTPEGIMFSFEQPLRRAQGEDIAQFCQRASEQLVSTLMREIKLEPACWEEWCHFHAWNVFAEEFQSPLEADACWYLDADNVDVLKMTGEDVLVSLRSGQALALTGLMQAVCEALSMPTTPCQLIDRLADRFPAGEVRHAFEVLHAEQFIVCTDPNQALAHAANAQPD